MNESATTMFQLAIEKATLDNYLAPVSVRSRLRYEKVFDELLAACAKRVMCIERCTDSTAARIVSTTYASGGRKHGDERLRSWCIMRSWKSKITTKVVRIRK